MTNVNSIFQCLPSIILTLLLYPILNTAEYSNHPRGLNFNIFPSIFRSSSECQNPPEFPSSIPLRLITFDIRRRKLEEEKLWMAFPKSSKDLVMLVNWAYVYEYKIRLKELTRSFAPLALPKNVDCNKLLIVDTNVHFVDMKMESANLVRIQTGASILNLLEFLEANNASLPVVPLGGEVTVGEAIAFGGFGTGVNPRGKKHSPFATFSSLVMNFKAIVWDKSREVYAIRSFERNDPRSMGFLTHLGRALITEVTLLVGPSYQLRCQTFSNFLSENLFASPNAAYTVEEESLAFLIEEYGKVEVIFFPYIDRTWVRVWTREKKPLGSIVVPKSFRLGSSSAIPSSITGYAMSFQRSFPSFTSVVSRFFFYIGFLRMRLSGSNDIYGPIQNTMYYTSSNGIQKFAASGYAVITSRKRIQQVVNDFYGHFMLLLKQFQEQGNYPVNRPVRIRISGLDALPQLDTKGLVPPALSVVSPMTNHSDFDVAVVFEINHRLGAQEFISLVESWFFKNYQENSVVRPLWSTEWGHTRELPWENDDVLKDLVPKSYAGGWSNAVRILDFYDPHKIFSNLFLESFLSDEK